MGGGDQDHGVAAQEDSGAPEEAAVAVEEGALPGELVLLGHGPAQDPLVTLTSASGRILQSWIMIAMRTNYCCHHILTSVLLARWLFLSV